MQQSQQPKEHLSLEVLKVHKLLLLLATTTPDGVDWMTCNRIDDILVQLSMEIKFMSLVDMIISKFSFFESENLFDNA